MFLYPEIPASTTPVSYTHLKLGRISTITETRPLESTWFSEKYVTYFTQPLDHRHPEKGSFHQRVIVSYVGCGRPTVIVTEGYGADVGDNYTLVETALFGMTVVQRLGEIGYILLGEPDVYKRQLSGFRPDWLFS